MSINIFTNSVMGSILLGVITNAKTKEEHNLQSSITQQAREDGENISNHIILRPAKLTIEFILTNMDKVIQRAYGIEAAVKYNLIQVAMRRRQTYTILTRHQLYFNMAIESFNAVNSNEAPGALFCTITFQQVRTSKITEIFTRNSLAQDDTQFTAAKTLNKGLVSTKDVASNSTLSQIESAAFGD